MFKTKQNTTPAIFQQKFKTINHKYPTKFSANNLLIPNQKNSNHHDFLYLPEVQRFGINFVTMEQKRLPLFPSFKKQITKP